MNKKTLSIVCIVLAVIWMILIFAYSAQHAEQSAENSSGIVDWVIKVFYPNYAEECQETQTEIRDNITFGVRKCAHMTEYALLSMLIYLACASLKNSFFYRSKAWIALAVSVVYATTDEIHQLFVPGRSGEVRDVLIDSLGALIGILIISLIRSAIIRQRKTTSEQ